MTESPGIFEAACIGGIALRNRFIRSATHEGMADAEGALLESLEKLYLRLARGGAGAIVTGYAGVNPQGRCSFPGMLMILIHCAFREYRQLSPSSAQAFTCFALDFLTS